MFNSKEYKRFIRCPKCDGMIEIHKEERFFKDDFQFIHSPHINVPRCVECGTRYNISLKTEGIMGMKFEEW